ncbi:MAG TPA: hypothetical protein VHD95_01860 [Rhizomicrobium sp.]|jgi:hypothetical protein|nr:hypothetical protein [Rhizomicrobium sp.]
MSELIQKSDSREEIRWKLLTGVSALVLAAYMASTTQARAEDTDRPTVWIELGGQWSTLQDGVETFNPALMAGRPDKFEPSQKFEKPARHGFDEFGAISLQPEGSNWVLSAAVQYGRSSTKNYNLEQTNPEFKYYAGAPRVGVPVAQQFAETTAKTSEQRLVVDFMAGKDVGLGLFGKDGTSVISAGVRFAQFISRSNIALKSDPDWHINSKYFTYVHDYISFGQSFHSNLASLKAERSFTGVGPSLSWKSSERLWGDSHDASLMLDWGVNGAILFGRQKTHTYHQSTGKSFYHYGPFLTGPAVPHTTARLPATPDHTRTRSVAVPNIGGFAGLSFKYPNAKVSLGYRADFFFGAVDGGIDARKTYDRSFYGPYATVSIGL